jgi:predicted ArsR family transcriptional regulator
MELAHNGVVKNVRANHLDAREPDSEVACEAAAEADAHVGTRNRVARLILADGPLTASELASRLDVTPTAIRRHLDALLVEGLVEAREQRTYGSRGRGRPAKVFALTNGGRSVFYQAYDALAVDALAFLAETAGPSAVEEFARRRIGAFESRHRDRIADADAVERPALLAEALTDEGYAASVREPLGHAGGDPRTPAGSPVAGAQVCQHHCPVSHVAERYPQLCEAETEAFSRLLGTHVQRLATIAHGDGVCTTFVPASTLSAPARIEETSRDDGPDAPAASGGNLS